MIRDASSLVLHQEKAGHQSHQVLRRVGRAQVEVDTGDGVEGGIIGERKDSNGLQVHGAALHPDRHRLTRFTGNDRLRSVAYKGYPKRVIMTRHPALKISLL